MNLEELVKLAGYFSQLKNQPDTLFSELAKIDKNTLDELKSLWNPKINFGPVNLLRFLIAIQLSESNKVNESVIQAFKKAIEARDISAYYESEELHKKLSSYKKDSKKSMFSNWNDSFKILHPFFYMKKQKKTVKDALRKMGTKIIEEHSIENAKIHCVGFEGPQNFGKDAIWGAVIPQEAKSVQKAYQLLFAIDKDGINGGLYEGKDLSNPQFQKLTESFDNWEDYLASLQDGNDPSLIDLWYEYNSQLLKPLLKHKGQKHQVRDKELNLILYGPPGTGKTYNTINQALGLFEDDLNGLTRDKIKELFHKKVDDGHILFTTFHQSMTYEDFVEGIKPIEPEEDNAPVNYRVQEGIFKKLCTEASFSLVKESKSKTTKKVLEFSLAYDNFVQELKDKLSSDELIELDTITGRKILVDSISQRDNILLKRRNGTTTSTVSKDRISKLHRAISNLENVGNINTEFRAIIGGCDSTVFWSVLKAIRTHSSTEPSLSTDRKYTWEEKNEVVQSLKNEDYKGKTGEPFVLIIDEINRGNVSQIFGELITLIESDKRLGNTEAIQVQLPYSKDSFGVPPNLYIIGTMNTADRSVEALDTALRRRFSFLEIPPCPEVIRTEGKAEDGKIKNIDLVALLEIINKRTEVLLDKDHMIGHSYFMQITDLKELKATFQNKIIPLLQEYFYGDYGKIGLVIGSEFFLSEESRTENDFFAPFEDYDFSPLLEKKVYHLINVINMEDEDFIHAINSLLGE